jgi:hypothetical protein
MGMEKQEILPNYGTSPEIAWLERAKPFPKEVDSPFSGQGSNVKGLHGTGVGDVNGDGRPDIVTLEDGSRHRDQAGQWIFHGEWLVSPF